MTDDQPADSEAQADEQDRPLNREQRRRQKYRHPQDAPQDNRRRQSENNPAFSNPAGAGLEPDLDEGPKDAVATATTEGPTALTGPGTGGATETSDRAPAHEGVHRGRPTKG